MDFLTIFGLIGGMGIVLGVMASYHLISHLWNVEAFTLVIGGTIFCSMFSFPGHLIKRVLKSFGLVFKPQNFDASRTIDTLVDIAQKARRSGMIAIEKDMKETKDPYLKLALKMLIDNIDPHVIHETLEHEIQSMGQRHKAVVNVWITLAGYAPTFGLIGTVLGLIIVLSDLSDIGRLGESMASAIIATFYGLYFANFFFGPVGMKLNAQNEAEVLFKRAITEGILSIQAGDVPYVTRTKLEAFLDNHMKSAKAKKSAADAGTVPGGATQAA